ncbi:MAG: hypothetical protein Q8K74_11050 [Candidatus Nitrotoga sp.]|nr:hypothetical protein [Candidatus Nitrotoga sp.]MDP1856556.1 hypothetical protein [Candidatus Nitrotoga sp.]
MTEFIPTEEWKATHDIGHEAFFLDVYRLLCYSSASRVIAELEDGSSQRPLSSFVSVNEQSEISRLLLHLAVYYRVKYDDGSWEHGFWLHKNFQGVGSLAEDVLTQETSVALDFREACNKIIHAKRVHFDIAVHEKTGVNYLNPIVYLYGSRGVKEWKATLDITQFCKAAGNVIV